MEPYQTTKEQKMTNQPTTGSRLGHYLARQEMHTVTPRTQLTVAELVRVLQSLPNQNALVDMAMNQEYQQAVEADDIHVWSEDLVIIGE
jgi:hypothetical protein